MKRIILLILLLLYACSNNEKYQTNDISFSLPKEITYSQTSEYTLDLLELLDDYNINKIDDKELYFITGKTSNNQSLDDIVVSLKAYFVKQGYKRITILNDENNKYIMQIENPNDNNSNIYFINVSKKDNNTYGMFVDVSRNDYEENKDLIIELVNSITLK